jgi:CHAT domain-containing protein
VGSFLQRMGACRSILGWQRRTGDRVGEIATLADIGTLVTERNQINLATAFYKQAINKSQLLTIKDWQTNNRSVIVPEVYRAFADNLLTAGQVGTALQVLEGMKLQELNAYSASGFAFTTALPPSVGVSPSPTLLSAPLPATAAPTAGEQGIIAKHDSLVTLGQQVEACKQTNCSELSQLNDQLQKLIEEYNATTDTYEKEIRQRRSEDDAFLDPRRLPKLREIVDAQPGTMLIYPLVLEKKIWLIWATSGGVIKSQEILVPQEQVGTSVVKFRKLVQTPTANRKEVQATSQQLYDWLIKPVAAEIKQGQVQHLVFALDRITRYIPVGALFDGQKYLIENYTVATVLSGELTDLRDRLPNSTQQTPVLAMGASEFVNFNPLPFVPIELASIVKKQVADSKGIYPGVEFLNKAFDWRSLRDNLTGHRILHIATHGAFIAGRPQDSYLVLGTSEKLAIPQIRTLQNMTNIHLVVLSACETAVGGPNQDGMEISGMSYYFMNSGAKAVMASLWSVNDASTSLLMQQFYQNLATRKNGSAMTKAQALRQAQLTLLKGRGVGNADPRGLGVVGKDEGPAAGTRDRPLTYAEPYFWAPFILIGNGL